MKHSGFHMAWNRRCGFILLTMAATCLSRIPATSAAVLTKLVDFHFATGGGPYAGLIADGEGNLYGTTTYGGVEGKGTIFRLDVRTNVLTTLAEFNGANGDWPRSTLFLDANGNLVGTTHFGGMSDLGTIFRLEAGTNKLSTLIEFNGENGALPLSSVIADAAGNFYGTTTAGGKKNGGTIFRLEAGTNTLTQLAEYETIGPFGASPEGGLIADAAGNYYGTTSGGGAYNRGTIFRIDAGTNIVTTLAELNVTQGNLPSGKLVADAAGNLYGTTAFGGMKRAGTIFRFDIDTYELTTIAEFDDVSGTINISSLIADAAGNFYGVRTSGNYVSEVFRVEAGTNVITRIVELAYPDRTYGIGTFANLIADAAGNLYGATLLGGYSEKGTIFKLSDAGFVVMPEPDCLAITIVAYLLMVLSIRSRRAAASNVLQKSWHGWLDIGSRGAHITPGGLRRAQSSKPGAGVN